MLKVLYEDNHLIVFNKPSGLATQPSLDHPVSLESLAKEFIKTRDKKPGAVYLHAIHRIDAPVSGVVVFAKTSKALSRLQKSIREKATYKCYIGWVEGILKNKEGTLRHFMLHGEHRALQGGDKEALLSYKVMKEEEGNSQVEILLDTGRYHQIRAQFSWIGHPLLGDTKYGSKRKWPQGIALHHQEFRIPHPVSKEVITFIAPIPFSS